MWSNGVDAFCMLVTRVLFFTLVNVYEIRDKKWDSKIIQNLSCKRMRTRDCRTRKKPSYLCKKLSLNKFLVGWLPHQFEELKHGSPRCQNQPAKQKHKILINNNLEAFKTIDGTCTIPPISDISKFACAHVWSACVITHSLIVTFAGGCLTFINICRKIKKKQRKKRIKYQLKS